jgi:receptor protein-tyrosine kinase
MASILMSGRNQTTGRALLVTSACRDDGKTTTVANLGIALAEIGQRVLLIDADMRKPRLHTIFDVPADPGLSDILRDPVAIADLPLGDKLTETQIKGLHVLASGSSPLSIAKLLHSRRVAELLTRLQSEFDVILIDTPPLLSMSDARVLGHLADSTVLVVRAGKTPRDLALAAKLRLDEDGIPLLGTILVAWDGKGRARYGAEHYFSSYYASNRAGD